uniref:Uncharacterized protein n=1 Tax=Panagrolaimus superbus TaxID=310955 RepID=A0A914YWP8_9BILA
MRRLPLGHALQPSVPEWTGWWIEFLFTSSNFHATESEFTLYGVKVFANYSSQETLFVGHKDKYYIYNQTVSDDTNDKPSAIAADIFANRHYSYFCSSLSKYPINTDESYGLKAW